MEINHLFELITRSQSCSRLRQARSGRCAKNDLNLRLNLMHTATAPAIAVAYIQTPHTPLHSHPKRDTKTPCLSSAHPESSAPRADSSKSSPASPRPHYSSDRSPPLPRAGAATHTATTTTPQPAGSSASSPARSLRRRAGRTSSTTASSAPSLSALLATGSSRTPGRFRETHGCDVAT